MVLWHQKREKKKIIVPQHLYSEEFNLIELLHKRKEIQKYKYSQGQVLMTSLANSATGDQKIINQLLISYIQNLILLRKNCA